MSVGFRRFAVNRQARLDGVLIGWWRCSSAFMTVGEGATPADGRLDQPAIKAFGTAHSPADRHLMSVRWRGSTPVLPPYNRAISAC